MKNLHLCLLAGCLASTASAQDVLDVLKPFTATKVTAYAAGGMDFENGAGSLDVYSLEARTLIAKPLELPGDFSLVPMLSYQATFLRYDNTPAGFPVIDEDLHSISLPLYAVRYSKESPWIYGAFFSPSLSTDFDHLDSDDIFLNAGVAAGYRLRDNLIVGGGVGYFDMTGDDSVMPGLGVLWRPTDEISVQLLGPSFSATYHMSADWRFGFDVRAAGGAWNIDSNDESRRLSLRSMRAGLSAQRRIAEHCWLEAGGGVTFANKVELKNHSGLGLSEATLDRLDEGLYGYIAFRKEVW